MYINMKISKPTILVRWDIPIHLDCVSIRTARQETLLLVNCAEVFKVPSWESWLCKLTLCCFSKIQTNVLQSRADSWSGNKRDALMCLSHAVRGGSFTISFLLKDIAPQQVFSSCDIKKFMDCRLYKKKKKKLLEYMRIKWDFTGSVLRCSLANIGIHKKYWFHLSHLSRCDYLVGLSCLLKYCVEEQCISPKRDSRCR